MGGKSSSKSSSSNTTNNNTHNESLNTAISGDVDEGAIAVSGKEVDYMASGSTAGDGSLALDGSSNVITEIDAGAFDFAEATINNVGGVLVSLMESQKETYGAANDLAGVAIANLAAASGADPVEIQKTKLTQGQKIALGVGGFVSVAALAGALWKMSKGEK